MQFIYNIVLLKKVEKLRKLSIYANSKKDRPEKVKIISCKRFYEPGRGFCFAKIAKQNISSIHARPLAAETLGECFAEFVF